MYETFRNAILSKENQDFNQINSNFINRIHVSTHLNNETQNIIGASDFAFSDNLLQYFTKF